MTLTRLEVPGKGRVTGKGQTIAILIDTLPLKSDVQAFWHRNGLAVDRSQLQLINVLGKDALFHRARVKRRWTLELAASPPGATVRVYAAGSLEWADIYRALDMIYADAQKPNGPRHLSLSFGAREDFVTPDQQSETMFLKLAALGVSTFVSSGDAGSNPDDSLPQGSGGSESYVEYPASDRSVIAVGGTTLRFHAPSGRVLSETGWPGSGGGVSRTRLQPAWQNSIWTDQQYRLVPDVNSVATRRGLSSSWRRGQSIWGQAGARRCGLQFRRCWQSAREEQGKERLRFLAPVLYKLPRGAGFRDITSGSNGAYQAGPGWDLSPGSACRMSKN